jgi:hypothetical protein
LKIETTTPTKIKRIIGTLHLSRDTHPALQNVSSEPEPVQGQPDGSKLIRTEIYDEQQLASRQAALAR